MVERKNEFVLLDSRMQRVKLDREIPTGNIPYQPLYLTKPAINIQIGMVMLSFDVCIVAQDALRAFLMVGFSGLGSHE